MVKTDLPSDYGNRIRRLRVSIGLTQMAFANLMGVSFASINRWENEQARPSALAWQKIVRAEQWGIAAIEDGFNLSTEQIGGISLTDDELGEPHLDFSSDPEAVRAVAEGERLSYGHLFNPAFATEISLIDPLPHQRIAVYGYMLRQPRLRFLLADDAGAGKTIMTGLYIREMLARRLIRRVLIVPPAGLVGNWERELRTLFSLSFRVVSGSEARSNNPFVGSDSDLLIVSIDTLAGERMFARLQESSVAPYDLVVFDEAHKLSANREPDFTIRKTDRYRFAEVVAGLDSGDPRWRLPWQCHHLLLLTATPHMGKDFPYYCLWRLLEPEVLSTFDAFGAYPFDARQRHFLRRTKEEMVRFDGSALYPTRVSDTLSYDLSQGDCSEQRLYREGRVLKTLLEKLERIRKELGSDKVFDVIGRLFEGVSLKEYMAQAVTEEGADTVQRRIEGTLTAEQVQALTAREQRLFGDGGDIQRELPRLRADMEGETYRRLLPGYVRRFIEKAAPLVDVEIEGDLDSFFSFRPGKPIALDPLWPVLETYLPEQRERLTVQRPRDSKEAIWLHPGEPCFERFRLYVCGRFARDALQGAVFIDPTAARPYLFHLAFLTVIRQADPTFAPFARPEVLEYRLLGLKQEEAGPVQLCPVEQLLVLKGGGSLPATVARFAAMAEQLREQARVYGVEQVARPLVEQHRQRLVETLPEREAFLRRGYDYQDAELASARARLAEKARTEDPRAKAELTRIKERQRKLATQREHALAILRREPDLIMPGEVTFLAHALVVPSSDPEDRKRHDAEIEAIAMRVAWAYEEAGGAVVKDVSVPEKARAAGLIGYPGFDLLSTHPGKEERNIEVKGRAAGGAVELSENEWARACNLRKRYWLYVVYDCASPHPRLLRVQDPFASLLVRARGGVVIGEQEVFAAAEMEQR